MYQHTQLSLRACFARICSKWNGLVFAPLVLSHDENYIKIPEDEKSIETTTLESCLSACYSFFLLFLLLLLLLWLLLINLFVLRVNRAVGIKSGPSLTEHVHPDLASSAKLVRRSKLNFLLQSKAPDPDGR